MVKLEVKVTGKPKPEVKWFKQGEELFPSEEYQMENFEDGTSVLVINNVYEDDTGEITFEAHNALGVAVTTTELTVEGTLLLRHVMDVWIIDKAYVSQVADKDSLINSLSGNCSPILLLLLKPPLFQTHSQQYNTEHVQILQTLYQLDSCRPPSSKTRLMPNVSIPLERVQKSSERRNTESRNG